MGGLIRLPAPGREWAALSGLIGLAGEQQDDAHGDDQQASGRSNVTNRRGTAVHDTANRVEEREPAERATNHEREQRPPLGPGPLHEKADSEHAGPTNSDGGADNERRDENGFELIPGASLECKPERDDADCGRQERQSRGELRSTASSPSHATQLARCWRRWSIGS